MDMDKLVSLCKRRGFIFQSSEIYGGLNGFWDYGPLGVELKRNVKEAWWREMVTGHDDMAVPPGAPEAYEMVGLDCSIIMHPQVWKCSGHYDLFVDKMVDCRESRKRYRADQLRGRWVHIAFKDHSLTGLSPETQISGLPLEKQDEVNKKQHIFIATNADTQEAADTDTRARALEIFKIRKKYSDYAIGHWSDIETLNLNLDEYTYKSIDELLSHVVGPDASWLGTLTPPREFNLMFKTIIGALGGEEDTAYLRPETAQGMFVNFKNVVDSSRVKVPFGIAQMGKSFRNEITPRNFTFRSREFEQMEMEFFCHPSQSPQWYSYWRDRRMKWYTDLGLSSNRLQLREHGQDELSHYSCGTSDIEYAFPFLGPGEYGELEGVAHRGDFDLRSHMEGKLDPKTRPLELEKGADGKPRYKGSGKDLTYFDDMKKERYTPHVIEPAAGADRATLAFLCEAYHEDQAPDDKGEMQTRVVLKFHPRLAPLKAAVFPLVKKDGMPELAQEIYRALKQQMNVYYDEKGAIGRRYRRQDEAGTPFCITVDGQSLQDKTVTVRDRDSLEQWRIKVDDVVEDIRRRVGR